MKFRKNVEFSKIVKFHDFQKNHRFSRFSQMCPERYVSPNLKNKNRFGEYIFLSVFLFVHRQALCATWDEKLG